jgi:hypothetical protein
VTGKTGYGQLKFRRAPRIPKPYVALHARVVHNLVNVVGCDAGLCGRRGDVENLTRQSAHLAHAVLLLLCEDSNLVPVDKDLLRAGNAILCVVGVLDALLDLALGRQRVDGSKGAGVGERGERVEVASCWIRVRNYFRREDALENTTL